MKKILLGGLVALLCGCNRSAHVVPSANDAIEQEYSDPIYYYDMDVYQTLDLTIEDYIQQALDSFVNDKDILPSSMDGKGNITWKVISGNVTIDEHNQLLKTEAAIDNEPIQLKAYYSDEYTQLEVVCEPNICLDEYVGYLLSYFTHDGEQSQSLKLAFTYDGLTWYPINNYESVYQPDFGTKALRDPSFIRLKDGGFQLVGTQGWNNPSIYTAKTDDFIHYTDEKLVDVNVSSEQLPLSETQAWAPEGFYDYQTDLYYIYWSSVDDKKVLYNMTTDFNAFSLPSVLIDVGFPIIDASIVKDGAHYYCLLKDERSPLEQYSSVFVGSSAKDFLSFDLFSQPITDHQAEGPFAIFSGYRYFLFYDDYTRSQYQIRQIDFTEGFTLTIDDYTNLETIENISHASAIAVTWDEIVDLLPE